MDLFEEDTGEQPVDINELMGDSSAPSMIPESGKRNRASTVALLSDSPVENYERMMLELSEGDHSPTLEMVKDQTLRDSVEKDTQQIMEILADPNSTEEDKAFAVSAISSNFRKEPRYKVREEALIADDPVDEEQAPEREEIRIGMAEQLMESFIYDAEVQELINQNKVFSNEMTKEKVVGFLEFLAPFSVSTAARGTIMEAAKLLQEDPSLAKSFILSGSFKKAVLDAFHNMSPEEKLKGGVHNKIFEFIQKDSSIYFGDENQFNQMLLGQEFANYGAYGTVDEVMDNISSILDVVGLGFIVRAGYKSAKIVGDINKAKKASDIEVQSIVGVEKNPVSVGETVASVNAERGRQQLDLVIKSEGDEVSQALFGVSREQAIASEVLPDPLSQTGGMRSKIADPMRNSRTISPDPNVSKAFNDTSAGHIFKGEQTQLLGAIKNDFYSGTGLELLGNQAQVGIMEGGAVRRLSGLFGTKEGGFSNPQQALEQAKFAFRDYGVTDKNITIMKKVNGEWIDFSLPEAKRTSRDPSGKFTKGEYAVRVDVDRPVLADDFKKFGVEMEDFDVQYNSLAKFNVGFSGTSGSLSRWAVSPDLLFRKEISRSAAVAEDKAVNIERAILKNFDEFSKKVKKLGGKEKTALMEHIKEANLKGLELADYELKAKGFSKEAIAAMKEWRNTWDTHFYYENADLVRTLNQQGYRLFENDNARFFAKPVRKNYEVRRAYDPASDSVVDISRQQLDELYDAEGTVAHFRRPTNIDGESVEWMVVRNTPTEYLRVMNEGDQVLNYRKGYYTRQYDAPKFIEKNVYKDGQIVDKRVVAYAGSIVDAKRFIERKATEAGMAPEAWGRYRDDIKDLATSSKEYWDLQSSAGRVAQRHRGQLLEDAVGLQDVSASPYILDPSEAAVQAARSLSGRMALRNFIETGKARAIENYKEYFQKDKYGRPVWTSADQLKPVTSKSDPKLAAARTAVEYINYIESGYINAVDEGIKAAANAMADTIGEMGLGRMEKAIRGAGDANAFAFAKNIVFTSYLALHPLRQLVLQPSQILRMSVYNPTYAPKMVGDAAKYLAHRTIKESFPDKLDAYRSKLSKGDKDTIDLIDASGLWYSVDRSNLVRGPLADLADRTTGVGRFAGKPIDAVRRAGYDLGEQINLLAHTLYVADKYKRAGKNLADPAIRDEIHGLTRAFSFDMNKAGDFPYNQNWAGPILQFMQIPHKAILTYFSRSIPGADRVKLMAADFVWYGPPGLDAVTKLIGEENLPQEPKVREALTAGLLSVVLNTSFSMASGRNVNIDYSSLKPYEMDGWAGLVEGIISGDMAEVVTSAPIYTLAIRDGSPFQEAIRKSVEYLKGRFDPKEGYEATEITDVLKAFSEISGGVSSAVRAKIILEYGKAVDKQGNVISDDVGFAEAAAQLFGFSVSKQNLFYEASKIKRDGQKGYKEEVESAYKAVQRDLRNKGIFSDDPRRRAIALGILDKVYGHDPVAMDMINKMLVRDMKDLDGRLIKEALDYGQIPTEETYRKALRDYTLRNPDADMTKLQRIFDDMQKSIEEYQKENKED